ncbi:MAG: monovalent cation/H(+) antiporter subunit G [Acidimicrobiia bacterium]
MIGRMLLLGGAILTLLAAVGMVRFDDVYKRMHALTKASTAGSLLLLLGAAISLSHPNDVTSLVLAAVLQVITSPVAANMVSRATYKTEGVAQVPGATGSRAAPSTRRRSAPSDDSGRANR